MARKTLAQLKEAVRNRADLHKDGNVISNSELTSYINDGLVELYDLMISADDARTFTVNAGVLSQTGKNEFVLPDDCYRLVSVHNLANGSYYKQAVSADPAVYATLALRYSDAHTRREYFYRWNPITGVRTLHMFPAPNKKEDIAVTYFPQPPELEDETDSVDNTAGWLEYVVYTAAISALVKIERDATGLMLAKKEVTRRIKKAISNLDFSGPTRIRKTTDTSFGFGRGGFV